MSIDVNVQNDLVIVTETTEDIVVNVSNAAGPQGPAGAAGVGVPVGGTTGQVLKKFSATNYDTYWAEDASGLTSVGLSVPTGLTVTNSPLTTNGTIAVGLASGYSIPTTASQTTWNTAYNDSIVSAAVTGTTTKTLTLNQQDGGSVTASWSDLNTDAVTSVFGRTGAVIATEGDYTLTQLGDVTLTSPTSGQVLKYNGTTWVNNTDTDTGLTSVGLTMPSAFAVANSPLTSNGTIAVTGAGTSAQYVRGDGQLANFPTSGGGGSSVNYYLNGSINQGTFGGVTYYEMSKTPIIGAGTDFTRTNGQGNGYIASFITDAGDPALLNIPGGNWNLEFYFEASSGGGNPAFYGEIYKVSSSNVFTLIASGSTNPEVISGGTIIDQYFTSIPMPQTSLLATDRIAIRVYVITDGRDITLHTENSNLCEVLTTFSTGLNALNGLTEQVQYFATGTSGTDFNIQSLTNTHTFNLPTASGSNTGKLSNVDWLTFDGKENVLTFSAPLSRSVNTVSIPVANASQPGYLDSADWTTFNAKVTSVSATSPLFSSGGKTPTLTIQQASGSQNGYLGSTDWTTFNSKQQALNGTGFVKATGTTISYDNSTYALDSSVVHNTGTETVAGAKTFTSAVTSTNFVLSGGTGNTGLYYGHINKVVLANYVVGGGIDFETNGGAINMVLDASANLSVVGSVTAASLIKSGGTSSQFLKADGSVDSTTYQPLLTNPVTGTGTTNYLPKWTSGSALGNSIITDSGSIITVGGVLTVSAANINLSNNYNLTGRNAANTLNLPLIGRNGSDRIDIDVDGYGTTIGGSGTIVLNPTGGNVGIGTASPAYRLDVNRSSLGAIAQFITVDGTYNPRLLINGTAEGIQLFATYSSGAEALMFGTANTERMRLTSNLIIGSNSDNGNRLQVTGNGYFSGSVLATNAILLGGNSDVLNFKFTSGYGNTSLATIFDSSVDSGNHLIFKINTAAGTANERMRIAGNGSVMIATSTNTGESLIVGGTLRVTGAATYTSNLTASSFIKSGGTSSQYLMADGSVTTGSALTITNRQTASYTLALTDADKLVEMNVATANNLTVPLNSSVAFAIGTKIDLAQYGAGQTTVVATGGVTLRSAGGALKLALQYSGASLVKIATNEWYLFGDITV